jgi:outer membrane protein assembly factor BamB
VADGRAFVTTDGGAVVAVSMDAGERIWRREAGVVADTGVGVGRNAVVAAARQLPNADLAGLVAYERHDGTVRWEREIAGFDAVPTTPPVLADGAVYYVSTESAGVTALGDLPPADGD